MTKKRQRVDPRGPRFGAAITAVLLLVSVGLALAEGTGESLAARISQPAFILFAIVTALFAWGTFAGIGRHPYGVVFRKLVRPHLAAAKATEDPTPPTFAQGVGLFVTVIGVGLHLAGVPLGLVICAAAAIIAALLNSVFDYCLGCQIYLLLVRAGVLGRKVLTA